MISNKFTKRLRSTIVKICRPPPPPPPIIPTPPPECQCTLDTPIEVDAGEEGEVAFEPLRDDIEDGTPVAAAWSAEPLGFLEGPEEVYDDEADIATYTAPEDAGDYWYKMTLTWPDDHVCVHEGLAHVQEGNDE